MSLSVAVAARSGWGVVVNSTAWFAGESVFIGFCVALIGHKLTEQAEHIGEATQSIVELYSLGGKPVNPYRH